METLNWTIEEFFKRVNRGEKYFADLIDDFREYQRQQKIDEYQQSLPFNISELKNECVILKFNRH